MHQKHQGEFSNMDYYQFSLISQTDGELMLFSPHYLHYLVDLSTVCIKIKLSICFIRRKRLLEFHSFLNDGYDYNEFTLVHLCWFARKLFSKHRMLSFKLLA